MDDDEEGIEALMERLLRRLATSDEHKEVMRIVERASRALHNRMKQTSRHKGATTPKKEDTRRPQAQPHMQRDIAATRPATARVGYVDVGIQADHNDIRRHNVLRGGGATKLRGTASMRWRHCTTFF